MTMENGVSTLISPDDESFAEKLAHYLAEAQDRIARVSPGGSDPAASSHDLAPFFEELSTSLEELSAAEDEMRRQNDLLIETRAEVEAARIRYQDLFDFAPDAYLVTDMQGVISDANQAATVLMGLDRKLLLGRPVAGFIPPGQRSAFRTWLNRVGQNGNGRSALEMPIRSRRGSTFDSEIRVAVGAPFGEKPVLRWLIRDVSERKRLEDEVRRANVELEQRVAERTAALAAANDLKDNLLVGEQEARARAEDLQRSSAFVAEAGMVLSQSLDLDETLTALANLLTKEFADWCRVYVVESGEIRTSAAAHRLPDKADIVKALLEHEVNPDSAEAPERVIETGQPVFIAQMTDEEVQRAASGKDHFAILRALDPSSIIVVPMVARGEVVGVIRLGQGQGRKFEPSDLDFAMELARRAGVAVDNARLYRLAQEQIAERQKAEDREKDLNRKLQRAMTETHHRVKNNLQLITAMIDMRLLDSADTISATDMRRLATQISILARVHDLLTTSTKSDATEAVPVAPVIDALLTMLRRAAEGRQLDYRVDDIELPSRQLSALALVVNELVSNAMKHSAGHVDVEVSTREIRSRTHVVAAVSDDGPGFPAGFNPSQSASTGLDLVQTLSRWDLGGAVEFTNREDGGARVVVTFPVAG